MSCTVAIDELSVGMYIQLDGGWLSHPFPLSSFRISSPEQIATLRGLGLSQVRWVPEKSDTPPTAAAAAEAAGAPDVASAVGAAPSVEEQAAQQRRRQLIAQREALQRCERQYGEAAQVLHDIGEAL
ncbi:MAG: DUF3391 domain-containing protein, partial [Rubrivivax sp.]|nr:DUF3391 domain-containing protein [Rubrivivax sp.]